MRKWDGTLNNSMAVIAADTILGDFEALFPS